LELEQVVYRALEKNPDKRYQQIEELLDDLKSISAGIVPEEIKVRLRKAKLLRRKDLQRIPDSSCLCRTSPQRRSKSLSHQRRILQKVWVGSQKKAYFTASRKQKKRIKISHASPCWSS
jgi:hypothetical protein